MFTFDVHGAFTSSLEYILFVLLLNSHGAVYSLCRAPRPGIPVGVVGKYGTPLFSNDKQQITQVLIAVIDLSLEKNQSNLTN